VKLEQQPQYPTSCQGLLEACKRVPLRALDVHLKQVNRRKALIGEDGIERLCLYFDLSALSHTLGGDTRKSKVPGTFFAQLKLE
jgi:hypothetical protein